jgi:hypothetical protein
MGLSFDPSASSEVFTYTSLQHTSDFSRPTSRTCFLTHRHR